MARPKKMTLDSLVATKPTPTAPSTSEPRPTAKASEPRRGQTLRLNIPAWKQLKRLAIDEETTCSALALEAVNMLFASRKLPPVA